MVNEHLFYNHKKNYNTKPHLAIEIKIFGNSRYITTKLIYAPICAMTIFLASYNPKNLQITLYDFRANKNPTFKSIKTPNTIQNVSIYLSTIWKLNLKRYEVYKDIIESKISDRIKNIVLFSAVGRSNSLI
jgi:hypothetical protein